MIRARMVDFEVLGVEDVEGRELMVAIWGNRRERGGEGQMRRAGLVANWGLRKRSSTVRERRGCEFEEGTRHKA